MNRFWVSWYQHTEDYRPIIWPLKNRLIAYWVSGYSEDASCLCALMECESEEQAKDIISEHWPDHGEWRFIEEKQKDWIPGDRFPLSESLTENYINRRSKNEI